MNGATCNNNQEVLLALALSNMRETYAKHVSVASQKLGFVCDCKYVLCTNVVVGGCYSNPCTNGATCVAVVPDTYFCECSENLSGRNCDETEFNGFKYLIVDERKDWNSARDSCIERGYNLTSIETDQEIEFLDSFVG